MRCLAEPPRLVIGCVKSGLLGAQIRLRASLQFPMVVRWRKPKDKAGWYCLSQFRCDKLTHWWCWRAMGEQAPPRHQLLWLYHSAKNLAGSRHKLHGFRSTPQSLQAPPPELIQSVKSDTGTGSKSVRMPVRNMVATSGRVYLCLVLDVSHKIV